MSKSVLGLSARQHVAETVRLWLGLRKEEASVVPDMPEELQHLFLRSEEYASPLRDQWGEWEHTFSSNYQRGTLWRPEVNDWLEQVRGQLSGGRSLVPLWPNNHRFAVCLTHDVDTLGHRRSYRQRLREIAKLSMAGDLRHQPRSVRIASRLTSLIGPFRKNCVNPDLKLTIETALEIERSYGAVSSFFFTVFPITRYSMYDCTYSLSDRVTFRNRRARVFEVMQALAAV